MMMTATTRQPIKPSLVIVVVVGQVVGDVIVVGDVVVVGDVIVVAGVVMLGSSLQYISK